MIDPTVRRGRPDDIAALGLLEREARAAVADTRGGARWLQTHPSIDEQWPAVLDERAVFVATIEAPDTDSAVVGYLVADVRDEAERIVVVEQVFVHPDARELGFGDELLAAAGEYGRSEGATLIEAETLPGDRDIKNLYERARITARLITVSRRL